ncbi:hypothetical protein GCM10029978_115690 [Actinoallomurus acanthiterrae]
MRPFRADEDLLFGGRANETTTVTDLWRTERLTILHGPPGVGKTSLLQAGVIPRLQRGGSNVLPVGRVAGGPIVPDAALPTGNPFTRTLLRTLAPGASLPATAVGRFLRDAVRRSAPALVAIDQAEDLFRGERADERAEFLAALAAAPDVHLLISVRDDRVDALLAELHPPAPARFRLEGLAPASASDAIRHPLDRTGRTIPATVADALVADLTTAHIVDEAGARTHRRLPTVSPWQLQAVCAHVWRNRPADGRSLVDHRSPPDADDALEEALWAAVAAVAAAFDRDAARLCAWVARTFVSPDGTPRAVAPTDVPHTLLDALTDRWVLRVRTGDGPRRYTPHGDRILRPLVRLARRADDLDPPLVTPAERLRAALDALADGDPARAEHQARQAAESPARDVDAEIGAHTILGDIAFARGDLAQAQDAYQRAVMLLETRRDQAAVGVMLAAIGRVSLRRGDAAGGLSLLRSAVARLPADRTMKTELARALADAGDPAAAAAMLGPVMTAAEDDDARILHGRIRSKFGERFP